MRILDNYLLILINLHKREYIMEFDLSLNRSLEELISSYWEAENEGVESDDFYVLENYLSDMGAL